jgi:hypothetical protein
MQGGKEMLTNFCQKPEEKGPFGSHVRNGRIILK